MSIPTSDPLTVIEELLRQRIGLKTETVGRDRIAQAVAARLAHLGRREVADYVPLVLDSEDERRALVDEVVVPETWFFRDVRAFRHLRRQVLRWRTRSPAQKVRLLSVPCCTGEEPYSMAMLLLDLGLGAEHFEIVASDISAAVLSTAERGTYSDRSFREEEADFQVLRDRYCRRTGENYVIGDDVRATVRFVQANLVGPQFLDGELPFHAIFCRNLFIYLEGPARQTALAHLRRLLRPNGTLYLASVESSFAVGPGLRREAGELPFVLIAEEKRVKMGEEPGPRPNRERPRSQAPPGNARAGGSASREKTPAPRGILSGRRSLQDVRSQAEPGNEEKAAASPGPRPPSDDELMVRAQEAADAGRLEEGAAVCAELLAKGPPRASVFYLLGVVREAQGNLNEAERCFQRTLYLDPRHREALVHMALLARRRGDERTAANFFQRAERLGAGG